jgi:UDPglucose 6-dehydrogenase
MKVTVAGLWHLGGVTAACLASGGHHVTAIDPDPAVIANLASGRAPVAEPGLAELIAEQIRSGRLRASTDYKPDRASEILYITFDTPVDEEDRADVEYVVRQIEVLVEQAVPGTLVLISSQLPVGTTARLERRHSDRGLSFAYSPENLRLGKALEVFTKPDRVVAGVRRAEDRTKIAELFAPWTTNILWMSVESAELSKHALNAFLATSVCFINEISAVAECAGADARDVERALKSDTRIGPRAYLRPGPAYAGGTLARDIRFLQSLGDGCGAELPLIRGVQASNDIHRQWLRRTLPRALGRDLRGMKIAVLGLVYKAGTDTLRRSAAVEDCVWMHGEGATVSAYDPAVRSLPMELADKIRLCSSTEAALAGSDAVVLATEWPQFAKLTAATFVSATAQPIIIDPARQLDAGLRSDARIRYYAIGMGDHAARR